MDDALHCPICGNKLRTSRQPNKLLHQVGKTADYAFRVCSKGFGHTLMIYADEATGQVDLLKLSLNPAYSRFLEIDFLHQKCRISCLKENKPEYIEVEKMIEPDFPDLVKLKERVSLYVVFS